MAATHGSTHRNHGLMIAMMQRVPLIAITQLSHCCVVISNVKSIISVSAVNRLMIRPLGVVSKKIIGALRTADERAEYLLHVCHQGR